MLIGEKKEDNIIISSGHNHAIMVIADISQPAIFQTVKPPTLRGPEL